MPGIKSKINIQELLTHHLSIPDYQRAYSWEEKHYNQFWEDIIEHLENVEDPQHTPYFIGHVLLEKNANSDQSSYHIIDGQQRITTIVILLAILEKLCTQHNIAYTPLPLDTFSTVSYDSLDFRNNIIHSPLPMHAKTEIEAKYDTTSMRKCIQAYSYFFKQLAHNQDKLKQIYTLLLYTECTIQIVEHRLDAIKRFIFENSRGKEASKLEVFKSLCLYHLYLTKNRTKLDECIQIFEEINRILEHINHSDDALLRDTYKVYYHTLDYDKQPEDILKDFKEKGNIVQEISNFCNELLKITKSLLKFAQDKKEHTNRRLQYSIQSLEYLGISANLYPFIIKAYLYTLSDDDKITLFQHIEKLIFRTKIIATKADLKSRIQDVYKQWNNLSGYQQVVERLSYLLNNEDETSWWWNYWNKSRYEQALQDTANITRKVNLIRYIFFKYEYALWENTNQTYTPLSFEDIERPEVEHITPQNPKATEGYCEYDDDFQQNYLNSLGNFILLPKKDNIQASNRTFQEKCKIYQDSPMYHIREIAQNGRLYPNNGLWDKSAIAERNKILLEFVRNEL